MSIIRGRGLAPPLLDMRAQTITVKTNWSRRSARGILEMSIHIGVRNSYVKLFII
jgi:hypothetical protein